MKDMINNLDFSYKNDKGHIYDNRSLMRNLFFIHTPMQLLVAQQIIRQENLHENIMLYGYVDDNVHFLKLYDLTVIDEFWDAKVAMSQVARWAIISRRHIIRDCFRVYRNYRFISQIIRHYNIDTIFLGDMKNISCQLAAMSFHRKRLRICFFEEGNGHYVMNPDYGKGGNFIDKIYAVFIDMFYYRPFYGVPFGYVSYWKGFTLSDLPIDVRYSFVPFYHEPFDKLVTYQPLFSKKLTEFLNEDVKQLNTNHCTLLLSSPCYVGNDNYLQPYVKTIINYAKSLRDTKLHIKFHPRDTQDIREMIMKQLDDNGINYQLIGISQNIPVEYYLQYIHYEKIVFFFCSTFYYNGYLFPKTEFVSILRDYYNNCKEAGSVNTKEIEYQLKLIPEE